MALRLLEEDALLRELGDSRRRFQSRMRQLVEKYNQPFENDPLVEMATLTYETPQGLRIWGGRLVKERSDVPIQVKRNSSTPPAVARGRELSVDSTGGLEADSEGSAVDASPDREAAASWAATPVVPQGPLETELRWKYLTQVDILLQDAEFFERAARRDGQDPCWTLATPAPGNADVGPAKPASSPQEWGPSCPGSADTTMVPEDASLCLLGTDRNSSCGSQGWATKDMCDVTISDLYAGMLRSMSRLLSTRPAGVISTRTSFLRAWSCRRRQRHKSRLNRTYCKLSRPSHRGATRPPVPSPKPGARAGVLTECGNLLDVSHRKTGSELKEALEENKSPCKTLDPDWKELPLTPWRKAAWVPQDASPVRDLGRENRLRTLQWLISPVKIVSRPGVLQGHGQHRYREIEVRFDKLHQEYCLSPRQQPGLPGLAGFWALDVRGGRSWSPGHSETQRPSPSVSRAKGRRLREAFEHLGRCLGAGGGPSEGSLCPSPTRTGPLCPSPARTGLPRPSHPQQGQGSSPSWSGKLAPSRAISGPRTESLGSQRSRYDEIKEGFDRLHQKYCHKPQQATAPAHGAGIQARQPADDTLHSWLQKSSPQCHRQSLLGLSTARDGASADTTRQDYQTPAKRRRLSDPQLHVSWANPRNSKVVPSPGPPGEKVHL
ncbi:Holliday junction recognition protein [Ochotona princeps]|uniref:Holliday junction recognition protein n=1 Tax=Ochotona princeps TaxID=9978 RepID=UPI00271534C5|nr:Holliday junction recognition protein [Ochotona princeps]